MELNRADIRGDRPDHRLRRSVHEEEERVRHAPRHSRQALVGPGMPRFVSAVLLQALFWLVGSVHVVWVAEQASCSPCSSPASWPTRSRTALAGRGPTSSGAASLTECRWVPFWSLNLSSWLSSHHALKMSDSLWLHFRSTTTSQEESCATASRVWSKKGTRASQVGILRVSDQTGSETQTFSRACWQILNIHFLHVSIPLQGHLLV